MFYHQNQHRFLNSETSSLAIVAKHLPYSGGKL